MLLEGVPGLAKTLTVQHARRRCWAARFKRIQFTPDLVPADLVGTRVYRPDTGRFDIELGPVFGNFLLADEINRAPAKVQSALLEVMQEHQVTIGGKTFPVPRPFLVHGHPEPDRVRGHLPAARGAGRPLPDEDRRRLPDLRRGGRGRRAQRSATRPSRARAPDARATSSASRRPPRRCSSTATSSATRSSLADATRNPADYGLERRRAVHRVRRQPARADRPGAGGARAGAAARPRPRRPPATCATSRADVLRHRLVLSYDALSDGVTADDILERVLGRGHRARGRPRQALAAPGGGCVSRRGPADRPPPARAPGRMPHGAGRRARPRRRAARGRRAAGRPPRGRRRARAPSSRSCARTRSATTCARSTRRRPRARASRTCACTCPSAR